MSVTAAENDRATMRREIDRLTAQVEDLRARQALIPLAHLVGVRVRRIGYLLDRIGRQP
jgi:hypothetical protein